MPNKSDYINLLNESPLSLATAQKALDLIVEGVSPETPNSKGDTLLHIICSEITTRIKKEPEAADFFFDFLIQLKDYKGNLQVLNASHKTPLQCLIDQKDGFTINILFALMKYIAGFNLLQNTSLYIRHTDETDCEKCLDRNFKKLMKTKNSDGISIMDLPQLAGNFPLQSLMNENPNAEIFSNICLLLKYFEVNPNTTNAINNASLLHLFAATHLNLACFTRLSYLLTTYQIDPLIRDDNQQLALEIAMNSFIKLKCRQWADTLLPLIRITIQHSFQSTGQNEGLAILSKFVPHLNKTDPCLYAKIRQAALQTVIAYLQEISSDQQLKILEHAKKEPIFCAYTCGFFTSRTEASELSERLIVLKKGLSIQSTELIPKKIPNKKWFASFYDDSPQHHDKKAPLLLSEIPISYGATNN